MVEGEAGASREWSGDEGNASLADSARFRYNTVQYNTTLFHYASHTQQKLVSTWGVGKHVAINYISICI